MSSKQAYQATVIQQQAAEEAATESFFTFQPEHPGRHDVQSRMEMTMEVRKQLWGVTNYFDLPGSSAFFVCQLVDKPEPPSPIVAEARGCGGRRSEQCIG